VKNVFDQYPPKAKKDMICFIMYDISDNRIRKKISDYLEEKGCVRVQKSIFLAQIERTAFQTLQEGLAAIAAAYENDDSIFFIPVPEDSLHKMRIIGKEIDFAFSLGREHTLFF
jgi:CRISPR-associated protein Cas2